MIRVEVIEGAEGGKVLETGLEDIRIGRAPTNELCLSDWHISGEHGRIVQDADRWLYRDLRSTNGSAIERNGTQILLGEDNRFEVELNDGDRLILGDRKQPVVIACAIREDPSETQRVVAVRPVTDISAFTGKIEQDAASLRSLYNAQKRIGAANDLDEVVDAVCTSIFELLPRATHVTVVLRDVDEDRYVPIATRGRDAKAAAGPIPVARTVFRKVVADRAAVLAANAPEAFGQTASILGASILSTLGVPLWKGDEIIGVLQVDNRTSSGIFRERDLELVTVLALQASLAVANARLLRRLQHAEERLRKENTYLKVRAEKMRFSEIIGDSAAMKDLFEKLRRVVDTRVTVLIEGETGTGKELIASAVHYQSKRRDKLFVAQNCAAVPENLLESELFGHKRGAFTGAELDKKGLFEIADGGTLFLDEVTEMPLSLQSKLLRALQEGEVRPVGATQSKKVDVRIVAATNRSLDAEVQAGRFREDLYYRLKVFPLQLPALRERADDIPQLAAHFLKRFSAEMAKSIAGFSQQATELMQSYRWPGNVRELENEIQRLVITAEDGGFVMPEHLSPRIRRVENLVDRIAPKKGTLKDMLDEVEKWLLAEALREHGGNKSATAKTLGITREGLHKKLSKFGM